MIDFFCLYVICTLKKNNNKDFSAVILKILIECFVDSNDSFLRFNNVFRHAKYNSLKQCLLTFATVRICADGKNSSADGKSDANKYYFYE